MANQNLIRAQQAFDNRVNIAIVVCLIGAGLAVTDERSLLPVAGSQAQRPQAFAVVSPPPTGGIIGGGSLTRRALGRRGPTRAALVPNTSPIGGFSSSGVPAGSGEVPQSFVAGAGPSTTDSVAALATPGSGVGLPSAISLPGVAGGGAGQPTTPGGGGTGGGGTGGGTGGGGTGGGDTTPITAVPEPSTWLVMVMGFGFVGAAARRARRRRGSPLRADLR